MRCDTGMPSRVIRLSTEQATRASVFWLGRVRARRPRPMMVLYRNTAVSPSEQPTVADRLLPAQAALVPDHPDVLVALTGRGVSGRARHGRGAGRDDHCRGRGRLALGPGAGNGFAVVGPIGHDRGDGAGDLIEQRADQGGVTLLDCGQLGGKDLTAVGIDREMEFAPGPLATLAILLGQPLAGAVHLQAS